MEKSSGSNTAKEHRLGQMELNTMENGLKEKCMGKEPSYMQIKICTSEALLMIKPMEEEYIPKKMEKYTRVTGWMIGHTVKACKKLLMDLSTKVNSKTAKNTVKVNTNGQTNPTTLVLGNAMSFMVMEHTFGPTVESMLVSGTTT